MSAFSLLLMFSVIIQFLCTNSGWQSDGLQSAPAWGTQWVVLAGQTSAFYTDESSSCSTRCTPFQFYTIISIQNKTKHWYYRSMSAETLSLQLLLPKLHWASGMKQSNNKENTKVQIKNYLSKYRQTWPCVRIWLLCELLKLVWFYYVLKPKKNK